MPKGLQGFQKGNKFGHTSFLGKYHTKENREKMSESHQGIKATEKTKIKISISNVNRWKKIIRKKRKRRCSADRYYRKWRLRVFKRDGYICQSCGAKSGEGKAIYLEAHHIKSWAKFPKLRYILSNGLTLCKKCHKLTDNYCGKKY